MSETKMYSSITEVAEKLGLPSHVLRFWETKMHQIQPMKRSGGRRFYRQEDVFILQYIQHLLHQQGYTIRGVQKYLKTMTKAQIVTAARMLLLGEPSLAPLPAVGPVEASHDRIHNAVVLLSSAQETLKRLKNQMDLASSTLSLPSL